MANREPGRVDSITVNKIKGFQVFKKKEEELILPILVCRALWLLRSLGVRACLTGDAAARAIGCEVAVTEFDIAVLDDRMWYARATLLYAGYREVSVHADIKLRFPYGNMDEITDDHHVLPAYKFRLENGEADEKRTVVLTPASYWNLSLGNDNVFSSLERVDGVDLGTVEGSPVTAVPCVPHLLQSFIDTLIEHIPRGMYVHRKQHYHQAMIPQLDIVFRAILQKLPEKELRELSDPDYLWARAYMHVPGWTERSALSIIACEARIELIRIWEAMQRVTYFWGVPMYIMTKPGPNELSMEKQLEILQRPRPRSFWHRHKSSTS